MPANLGSPTTLLGMRAHHCCLQGQGSKRFGVSPGSWNSRTQDMSSPVLRKIKKRTLHHGLPNGASSLVSSHGPVQGTSHKATDVPGTQKYSFPRRPAGHTILKALSKVPYGPHFETMRHCPDLLGLTSL